MKPSSASLHPLWSVSNKDFVAADTEKNGNKFLIGNGYMGLRGTLEEHGPEQLAACTLSGLYDRRGDQWREPVNAPFAFGVRLSADGQTVSTLDTPITAHSQLLDLNCARHHRETSFRLAGGQTLTVSSSRFLSLEDKHLGVLQLSVSASTDCELVIETGIDGKVWDINGPHLKDFTPKCADNSIALVAKTGETDTTVVVATSVRGDALPLPETVTTEQAVHYRYCIKASAGETYTFTKYIAIHTGADSGNPLAAALATLDTASRAGWLQLLQEHTSLWAERWHNSDVQIEGDDEAQRALRYSIYHLLIAAPASERTSIPARGLSGQVYKGAIFWDTEIFMLPFFDHTQPALARNLVRYRYHTLDGARRKAAEYGFRGAYYAWESQESGDDACTLFNITDVLTNRPMRTYFRDKQIHISADVALAVWRHYTLTGDADVLVDGGAEVILECARFFYSYAWYKPEQDRYELLDVVGPDEYHERVNNNAFTSAMARATLDIALKVIDLLEREYGDFCKALLGRLDYAEDRRNIALMRERLHVPAPCPQTGLIEQFSGYYQLEDSTPAALRQRLLDPNEYWGGGNGIATCTQVIKQADVVLMLHLFASEYSADVKAANWDYYEPRTEHGSSLSPCVYALVAAELGRTQWAYRYFLRTATIDLNGDSKQFVGPLYIGGTHPAANGGAWMAAILGFGGLDTRSADVVRIKPQLPDNWKQLDFRFCKRGQWFSVTIDPKSIQVCSDASNGTAQNFVLNGATFACEPGQSIRSPRD